MAVMAGIPALKDTHTQLRGRMEKAVEDFRKEMSATRTGRANVHMLDTIIQTGGKDGMVLMDASIYDLYCRALISYDTALSRARSPERMTKKTRTSSSIPIALAKCR